MHCVSCSVAKVSKKRTLSNDKNTLIYRNL
nr:MAG TPA: hypothetical protein [Caudoviricetes sp.]